MTSKPSPAPAKVKLEPLPELEHHLILRVPEHTADDLRGLIQSGGQMLKDYLKIEMHTPDMRHALVQIDEETFAAKVVDFPCILESHKTFDKKSFWKTADIAQMIVCNVEDAPLLPEDEAKPGPTKKPEKVDKKFIWKHGVTPPLKNVRKRRFRKTARKKYIEAPDVEEEVKRLLRMDSTATKVRWEVLAEEDVKDDKNDESMGSPPHGDIMLQHMFGDVSSSDEEDDDEDDERRRRAMMEDEDMDVDIEDLEDGDDPNRVLEGEDSRMGDSDAGGQGDDEDEEEKEEDGVDEGQEENELAKRLSEVQQELEAQETKKKSLEESIANINNPMLKQRFQSQLEDVLTDMKKNQEEVETLQVIVGNR